jgi:hypothetical protein
MSVVRLSDLGWWKGWDECVGAFWSRLWGGGRVWMSVLGLSGLGCGVEEELECLCWDCLV